MKCMLKIFVILYVAIVDYRHTYKQLCKYVK